MSCISHLKHFFGKPIMTEQEERDERAIIRVLHRYSIAMDARRWDLFDGIFTDDVIANYPLAPWTDLETFKREFAAAHAGYDATQHAIMTPLVEVSGDKACSFAYVSFRLIRRGTPDHDVLHGQGWYDDHFVRTRDGWRIRERNCRIIWAEQMTMTAGSQPEWHPLRLDAAEGKVGYLAMFDKRSSKS
jgi:hypothetical protein